MERKALGLTQAQFAEKMSFSADSRQQIGKWESGDIVPDLDRVAEMCKLFKCEVGYLLGEIKCKTREITDIQAATGLSAKAIRNIKAMKRWHDDGNSNEIIVLDRLLAGKFDIVLGHIDKYIGISKALSRTRKKRIEIEKQYKEKTWSTRAEKFDIEYNRTNDISHIRDSENNYTDKQESKLHRIQKDFIFLVEKIAAQEKEVVTDGDSN